MGRGSQLAITLILLPLLSWCQCSDSIKVISEKGCKRYSVSQGLMVDLFVAKRSLDTTHTYIRIIQSKLDSVLIKDALIEANNRRSDSLFVARESEHAQKDSICSYTIMRHKQMLSDVVKGAEGINLRLSREKGNRWKYTAGGALIVMLIEVIALIAF